MPPLGDLLETFNDSSHSTEFAGLGNGIANSFGNYHGTTTTNPTPLPLTIPPPPPPPPLTSSPTTILRRKYDASLNYNPCDVNNNDARTTKKKRISMIRRSVQFSSTVIVQETLHTNNFTKEEFNSYWYTQQEYDMISKMADITYQLMKLGTPENEDNGICYRGLKTKNESKQSSIIRAQLLDAIRQEQKYGRQQVQQPKNNDNNNTGRTTVIDSNRLSHVCTTIQTASNNNVAAIERAQQDANDALEYLTSLVITP
jgi:hypothetical protein